MDFTKLIGANLAATLISQGITTPTPIQAQAMPHILAKDDVIAQSPTGTGKTLAYLLPVFAALNTETKAPQAIIIAPTYELAAQIAKVAQGLAAAPTDVALIIGTASKARQLETLKAKPKIIVGSIGRVLEHMKDKKLSVHHVKTLVFDEADRLFTPENFEAITKLVKATLKHRQILLFSASLPDDVLQLAKPLMKEPVILLPKAKDAMPPNIRHYYIICEAREKFDTARKLVHALKITQAIVFVNIPFTIEKVTARLNFHKLNAVPLYGSAQKIKRKQAMQAFREGRVRLLVASDIGSRGLDIPSLAHIINLDLPESEKDYLHRAGRCGRMGRDGMAISLTTRKEAAALTKFAKKLGILVQEAKIARGRLS